MKAISYICIPQVRRWVKFSLEELREYRNNADREFFMGKGGKNANGAKIRALFRKYIDEDYDAEEDDEPYIGQDGIISFSEKIGINAAEDIEILVLSWLMDCTEMGCWTEKEFYLGLSRLKFVICLFWTVRFFFHIGVACVAYARLHRIGSYVHIQSTGSVRVFSASLCKFHFHTQLLIDLPTKVLITGSSQKESQILESHDCNWEEI